MGRAVIRQGDPTSHGGKVLEGFPHATIHGKPVAARGHQVLCPLCEGSFPISEGLTFHTFAGVGTAVEGMRTACGAILIATQHDITIDDGGTDASFASPLDDKRSQPLSEESQLERFEQYFVVVDPQGRPLSDMPFLIVPEGGTRVTGRTSAEEATSRLKADTALSLSIEILEDAPPINPWWDR